MSSIERFHAVGLLTQHVLTVGPATLGQIENILDSMTVVHSTWRSSQLQSAAEGYSSTVHSEIVVLPMYEILTGGACWGATGGAAPTSPGGGMPATGGAP